MNEEEQTAVMRQMLAAQYLVQRSIRMFNESKHEESAESLSGAERHIAQAKELLAG